MNVAQCKRVAFLATEVAALSEQVVAAQAAHDKAVRGCELGSPEWRDAYYSNPGPSPKLTGELRRRSMDLTRALADLRRP